MNDSDIAEPVTAESKAEQTAMAKLALHAFTCTARSDGSYVVSKWSGWFRELPHLAALERFVERLERSGAG